MVKLNLNKIMFTMFCCFVLMTLLISCKTTSKDYSLPDVEGVKYMGYQNYVVKDGKKFIVYHTPRQSEEFFVENVDERTLLVFPIVETNY